MNFTIAIFATGTKVEIIHIHANFLSLKNDEKCLLLNKKAIYTINQELTITLIFKIEPHFCKSLKNISAIAYFFLFTGKLLIHLPICSITSGITVTAILSYFFGSPT